MRGLGPESRLGQEVCAERGNILEAAVLREKLPGSAHGKNYTDILMDLCDLTDIPIWDSKDTMTCKEMDYFSECSSPKVCSKSGCTDCPSGNHLCERDRGYYKTSCPDGRNVTHGAALMARTLTAQGCAAPLRIPTATAWSSPHATARAKRFAVAENRERGSVSALNWQRVVSCWGEWGHHSVRSQKSCDPCVDTNRA